MTSDSDDDEVLLLYFMVCYTQCPTDQSPQHCYIAAHGMLAQDHIMVKPTFAQEGKIDRLRTCMDIVSRDNSRTAQTEAYLVRISGRVRDRCQSAFGKVM